MGKTITLRSFPRLDIQKITLEAKMNLIISTSILCFISLVASIPAPGHGGEKDTVGVDRMEEANRQADESLLNDFADAEEQKINRENLDVAGKAHENRQAQEECLSHPTLPQCNPDLPLRQDEEQKINRENLDVAAKAQKNRQAQDECLSHPTLPQCNPDLPQR